MNVFSVFKVSMKAYNICHHAIFISYGISTIKYWLLGIFKENELASSPLTLDKTNILWY